MLLMDLSISSKRNVSAFQATFFEMLSAWSASFLAGMTRISREMNHRACKERRRRLLPMRLRLLPSHSFRHSRFTLANRITSVLPTIHPELLSPLQVDEQDYLPSDPSLVAMSTLQGLGIGLITAVD